MVAILERERVMEPKKKVKPKKVSVYAQQAMDEFETAVEAMAFIGATHWEQHNEIKNEYRKAKAKLLKHLAK